MGGRRNRLLLRLLTKHLLSCKPSAFLFQLLCSDLGLESVLVIIKVANNSDVLHFEFNKSIEIKVVEHNGSELSARSVNSKQYVMNGGHSEWNKQVKNTERNCMKQMWSKHI